MTKHIFITVYLFLIAGTTTTQDIKIVTYNIRYNTDADGVNAWSLRKDKFKKLLHQYEADIWCFQEVLHNQFVDLKTMLSDYNAVGVGRDDGKEAGEYAPIFYHQKLYHLVSSGTFWLSPTPHIPGSKGWDAAITRLCTWVQLQDKISQKKFYVFNTHFDHIGIKARQESAQLVINKMKDMSERLPILLAGDLNSEPNSNAYQTITYNPILPLTDSYTPQSDSCTFTDFKVNGGVCKRIDFIFFDTHFNKRHHRIITDNDGTYYPSDHLPVLSIVELK